MKKNILLFTVALFTYSLINGQVNAETEYLSKIYHGTWINKKTNRYLQFYFDDQYDYITVNDWTGSSNKSKSKTLDSYKAFMDGEKLILPSENGDHHCPYCEITIKNKKLLYKCNELSDFTNNKLVESQFSNQTIFEKLK